MLNNRLLTISLIAVACYWIAGIIIPDPIVSSTSSFALLFFGVITLVRYLPVAYEVVFLGRRLKDNGNDGSHLAVYGTTLLAAGAVYVGVFGLAWIIANRPPEWLGTPVSGFGRAMMAAGFWLMYRSPDVVKKDIRVPGLMWVLIVMSASVLAGIFLGSQLEIR